MHARVRARGTARSSAAPERGGGLYARTRGCLDARTRGGLDATAARTAAVRRGGREAERRRARGRGGGFPALVGPSEGRQAPAMVM
jgi:hypothetical protein